MPDSYQKTGLLINIESLFFRTNISRNVGLAIYYNSSTTSLII